MTALMDGFRRKIDYLRLSVTDHCNLRCVYCLPARGFLGSNPQDILTDEEVLRIASIAIGLGINKIRLTGGEPLVRPGIVKLVGRLAVLPGLKDISLSTNGMLLPKLAGELYGAGLRRINVSLDTLRPDRFRAITRWGRLEDVLEGIETALDLGFSPVKVNMVVIKGINSDEIQDFLILTRRLPVHVRFIELMPIGETGFFSQEHWLGLQEIMAQCGELVPIQPEDSPRGFGPAVYFKPPGAMGTVGFIAALSCNFCNRCNRMRLTARGRLVPCLASETGMDLKGGIRSGISDDEIAGLIRRVVAMKPERHEMEAAGDRVREAFMCALGG